MDRGLADSLYISTAGIGEKITSRTIAGTEAKPGDVVIVTGTMGDHGTAILSEREGMSFRDDDRIGRRAPQRRRGGGAQNRPRHARAARPDPGALPRPSTKSRKQHRDPSRRSPHPREARSEGRVRIPGARPPLRRERREADRDLPRGAPAPPPPPTRPPPPPRRAAPGGSGAGESRRGLGEGPPWWAAAAASTGSRASSSPIC